MPPMEGLFDIPDSGAKSKLMDLKEVAEALCLRPQTIIRKRVEDPMHPLFSKAVKPGGAHNSPLAWFRDDVDAYIESLRGDVVSAGSGRRQDVEGIRRAVVDLRRVITSLEKSLR
ncbi:hypothetical protein HYG77_09840 [Rhodococcus sp. ZPP]|uniref:helix-turn-helix transcriptional regulator n=1 Tax=Rhodococcus sp. ZPP TaxID=2749906 RepID=UPI001AD8824A|nr:hypothetical protein [Rhodococcus sp. ZPP]QTJ65865.1 hypothetical protein HYG77_09840 [Rhodococcus sp. ZPP]